MKWNRGGPGTSRRKGRRVCGGRRLIDSVFLTINKSHRTSGRAPHFCRPTPHPLLPHAPSLRFTRCLPTHIYGRPVILDLGLPNPSRISEFAPEMENTQCSIPMFLLLLFEQRSLCNHSSLRPISDDYEILQSTPRPLFIPNRELPG